MAGAPRPVEPPNGGYGWVITFASFMLYVVAEGTYSLYGIFFSDISHYFKTDRATTALAGSVSIGSAFIITGIIMVPLLQNFTGRTIAIAFSFLTAVSLVACTFATTITSYIILYGVFAGTCLGAIDYPALVDISFYFTTRRAIANGIATSGGSIGVLALAPLFQYLLQTMDWKNAYIIAAGICLHGCAAGALLRPLSDNYYKRPSKPLQATRTEELTLLNGSDTDQDGTDSCAPQPTVPTTIAFLPADHLSRSVPSGLNHYYKVTFNQLDPTSVVLIKSTEAPNTDQLPNAPSHRFVLLPGAAFSYRDFVFAGDRYVAFGSSNFVHQLTKPPSAPAKFELPAFADQPVGYIAGQVTSAEDAQCQTTNSSPVIAPRPLPTAPPWWRAFLREARTAVDANFSLGIYKHFHYLMCLITYFLTMLAQFPFYFYVSDLLDFTVGNDQGKATLFVIMGLAASGGRFIPAFGLSGSRLRPLQLQCIIYGVISVASWIMLFCRGFAATASMFAIVGAFLASIPALVPSVLVEIFGGVEQLNASLGPVNVWRGVGCLAGPPLAGLLTDATNTLQAPYIWAAFVFTAATAFAILVAFGSRTCCRRVGQTISETNGSN